MQRATISGLVLAAVLGAGLFFSALPEAHAGHINPKDVTLPCKEPVIRTYKFPVIYDGVERQNPDGTLYPGDAVNFIIKWEMLNTCMNPRISDFRTDGAYTLTYAEVVRGEDGNDHTGPGPDPIYQETWKKEPSWEEVGTIHRMTTMPKCQETSDKKCKGGCPRITPYACASREKSFLSHFDPKCGGKPNEDFPVPEEGHKIKQERWRTSGTFYQTITTTCSLGRVPSPTIYDVLGPDMYVKTEHRNGKSYTSKCSATTDKCIASSSIFGSTDRGIRGSWGYDTKLLFGIWPQQQETVHCETDDLACRHPLEDPESIESFKKEVGRLCSNLPAHKGCVYGRINADLDYDSMVCNKDYFKGKPLQIKPLRNDSMLPHKKSCDMPYYTDYDLRSYDAANPTGYKKDVIPTRLLSLNGSGIFLPDDGWKHRWDKLPRTPECRLDHEANLERGNTGSPEIVHCTSKPDHYGRFCMGGPIHKNTYGDGTFTLPYAHFSYLDIGYQAPVRDTCTNQDHTFSLTVRGTERICWKENEAIHCKFKEKKSTARTPAEIRDPTPEPIFSNPVIHDLDDLPSRNLDGTYYAWDVPSIRMDPHLLFRDQRNGTLTMETRQHGAPLERLFKHSCEDGACAFNATTEHSQPKLFGSVNGDYVSIHRPEGLHKLGNHTFTYDLKVFNLGREISLTHPKTWLLIVDYDPRFEAPKYQYTVFDSEGDNAVEKEKGIGMSYLGSYGGGPGDESKIHDHRRAKINAANLTLMVYSHPLIDNVTTTAVVAGGEGLEKMISGIHPSVAEKIELEEDVPESSIVNAGIEAAQFEKHGLGKVSLRYYDDIGTRWNTVRAVIGNTTIFSNDFAGYDSKNLGLSRYMYVTAYATTELNVTAYAPDGSVDGDVSIEARVYPLIHANHTMWLPDYVHGHLNLADEVVERGLDVIDHTQNFTAILGEPGRYLANNTFAPYPYPEKITDERLARGYAMMQISDIYDISNAGTADGAMVRPLNRPIVSIFPDANELLDIDDRASFTRFRLYEALETDGVYNITITATDGPRTLTHRWTLPPLNFDSPVNVPISMKNGSDLFFTRNYATIIISAPWHFGQITNVYADGEFLTDNCEKGCSITLERNATVTVENKWGGTAEVKVVVPKRVVTGTPGSVSLAYFDSILPIGIIIIIGGAAVLGFIKYTRTR